MVKTKNIGIIIFIFSAIMSVVPSFAKEKVAITPFKINAEKELEYLKTAIPEMFFSRLPLKNKEIANTDDVKALFDSGFDIVITGSYTKLGNAFSLDIRVNEKPDRVKSYYSSKEDQSKLISAIDEIIEKIVGKAETREAVSELPQTKFKRLSIDKTNHPVYSFTLADINGDGKKEFITATENSIFIYSKDFKNILFEKKLPMQILTINSGDFNKNLKEEVYITAVRNEDPVTLVFEMNDNKLEKVYEEEIYINIIEGTNGEKKLIGQKPAVNGPFDSGIFEVFYDGKKLIKGKNLDLPNIENLNIYQIKPLRYKDSDCYLYIDESDYYRIIDKKGKVIERFKERYGGSVAGISRGVSDQMSKFASLPARIFIIKGENSDELLTIKNEGSRLFLRSKRFDRGKIVILKSDELSYKEIKESETFDGYISDLAFDKTENCVYISIVTGNKEGR
ncbi:MAG: hypothetical protein N2999_05300, partial [Proteobacteria bacterium]|nr:hypothetical protein [Pseudomonadota bacterium]